MLAITLNNVTRPCILFIMCCSNSSISSCSTISRDSVTTGGPSLYSRSPPHSLCRYWVPRLSPELLSSRSHVPLFDQAAYTRIIVKNIPTALRASLAGGRVGANQLWHEVSASSDPTLLHTDIEGSFVRPLTIAAQNNIQCLHTLLQHNALVNVQRDGLSTTAGEIILTYSALHHTVQLNNLFGTYILLKAGANPNIEGEAPEGLRNHTVPAPLHYAIDRAALHCAVLLLIHGAKPANSDINGRTALHYTGMRNHDCLASTLLDFDRSIIDKADMYGNTALHYAARRGFIEVARVMRWFGSNPTLANRDGVTAEQLAHEFAEKTGDPTIVQAVTESPSSPPYPPFDKAEYELCFSLIEKQVCRILHVEKLEYPHPAE